MNRGTSRVAAVIGGTRALDAVVGRSRPVSSGSSTTQNASEFAEFPRSMARSVDPGGVHLHPLSNLHQPQGVRPLAGGLLGRAAEARLVPCQRPPGRQGPKHVHTNEGRTYDVLAGLVKLELGGETHVLEPDALVFTHAHGARSQEPRNRATRLRVIRRVRASEGQRHSPTTTPGRSAAHAQGSGSDPRIGSWTCVTSIGDLGARTWSRVAIVVSPGYVVTSGSARIQR